MLKALSMNEKYDDCTLFLNRIQYTAVQPVCIAF
jgi:hypothetical protein